MREGHGHGHGDGEGHRSTAAPVPAAEAEAVSLYDTGSHERGDRTLVKELAARLKPYQRDGLEWMWERYVKGLGFFCSDEPGLGKTRQMLSLLAAIYGKTGTHEDFEANRTTRQEGLRNGRQPTLLILENNLIPTWKEEIGDSDSFLNKEVKPDKDKSRTHLSHYTFGVEASVAKKQKVQTKGSGERQEAFRNNICDRSGKGGVEVKGGKKGRSRVELVFVTRDLFKSDEYLHLFQSVDWELVIVEEAHEAMNAASSQKVVFLKALNALKETCSPSTVFALVTGTLVQNKVEEVFNAIEVVGAYPNEHWHEKVWFTENITDPLRKGHTSNASLVQLKARTRATELYDRMLLEVSLRRTKKEVLPASVLMKKLKYLHLCDMTPLQRRLYSALLALPEVHCILRAVADDDDDGKELVVRQLVPYAHPERPGDDTIDPRAVMWMNYDGHKTAHGGYQFCVKKKKMACPHCLILPIMTTLQCIMMHPVLLLVADPGSCARGFVDGHPALLAELQAVKNLGSKERWRSSGKMVVLEKQLQDFLTKREKTLVFCSQVRMRYHSLPLPMSLCMIDPRHRANLHPHLTPPYHRPPVVPIRCAASRKLKTC